MRVEMTVADVFFLQWVGHAAGLREDVPQPPPGLDLESLKRLIRANGMAPLLAQAPPGGAVDEALGPWLKSQWQEQVGKRLLQEGVRAQVATGLREAGVPVLITKGGDLAWRLYPDPALRPMGDLDLLVRPEDFARAMAWFEGAGFVLPERKAGRERYGLPAVLSAPAGPVIELHRQLCRPSRYRLDYGGIWERSQPASKAAAQRLSNEDAFLYGAIHLVLHGFVGPLTWYVDLAFLHGQGLDRSALVERARSWGCLNAVWWVAALSEGFYPELLGWLDDAVDPSPLLRMSQGWLTPTSSFLEVRFRRLFWSRLLCALPAMDRGRLGFLRDHLGRRLAWLGTTVD